MIPARSTPPSFPERLLSAILGTGSVDRIHRRRSARRIRAAGLGVPAGWRKPRADVWYCLQVLALGTRSAAGWRAAPAVVARIRTPPVTTPLAEIPSCAHWDSKHGTRCARSGSVPGSARSSILTLALGLGANAAVFENIDALILRPFTIHDVDRVVMVAETSPQAGDGGARESVSPANFLDWKRQTDVFERLAAFEWWDVNLAGVDDPERVSGFLVSADFFPALGVAPALGRAFTADEETRGRHRRAIIGHNLWQRRFQGDPGVIGKAILLDAEQYEVVGVAPAGFRLSDGRGNLGAAVVRRGDGRTAPAAISVGRRPARVRAIGR